MSVEKTSVLLQNFSEPTVGLAVHQKMTLVFMFPEQHQEENQLSYIWIVWKPVVFPSPILTTHLMKDCYQNNSYGKRPSLLCSLFQISHNKPINHCSGNCPVGREGAQSVPFAVEMLIPQELCYLFHWHLGGFICCVLDTDSCPWQDSWAFPKPIKSATRFSLVSGGFNADLAFEPAHGFLKNEGHVLQCTLILCPKPWCHLRSLYKEVWQQHMFYAYLTLVKPVVTPFLSCGPFKRGAVMQIKGYLWSKHSVGKFIFCGISSHGYTEVFLAVWKKPKWIWGLGSTAAP